MKYILNTSTNTYHIEGCCHNSFSEKKVFNTENEVIKYGGKNVRLCKLCQKKYERQEQSRSGII